MVSQWNPLAAGFEEWAHDGGMANIFMAHDGGMDEWAIFSFVV